MYKIALEDCDILAETHSDLLRLWTELEFYYLGKFYRIYKDDDEILSGEMSPEDFKYLESFEG